MSLLRGTALLPSKSYILDLHFTDHVPFSFVSFVWLTEASCLSFATRFTVAKDRNTGLVALAHHARTLLSYRAIRIDAVDDECFADY